MLVGRYWRGNGVKWYEMSLAWLQVATGVVVYGLPDLVQRYAARQLGGHDIASALAKDRFIYTWVGGAKGCPVAVCGV